MRKHTSIHRVTATRDSITCLHFQRGFKLCRSTHQEGSIPSYCLLFYSSQHFAAISGTDSSMAPGLKRIREWILSTAIDDPKSSSTIVSFFFLHLFNALVGLKQYDTDERGNYLCRTSPWLTRSSPFSWLSFNKEHLHREHKPKLVA